MSAFSIHPAARLMIWLCTLIAIQRLSGVWLLLGICVPFLMGRRIVKRGVRLVFRTRWLLVSLFVIFAWGTTGEPLWAAAYAPTYEGLCEAGTHIGRLVLVLMAVAAFLERMSTPELLAATHASLMPLRFFGLDPDRGVVRLMLALRYAESLPRARDWKVLLEPADLPHDEVLEIGNAPIGWRDRVLVLAALLMVVSFYGLDWS